MWVSDIAYGFYNSFYIVVLAALYFAVRNAMFRQLFLLVASYVVYWMISGRFATLLLWISVIDFLLVKLMLQRPYYRRLCLSLSIVSNFSVLFYFKYSDFFLDQVRGLLSQLGGSAESVAPLIAPLGISFIVFHGVSYSIDAYRGKITRSAGLLQYLLYVAYFPKILSGPITRATEFMPQLATMGRVPLAMVVGGGELILLGLFKKIVLASFFAKFWNELHAAPSGGVLLVYAAGASYGLFLLADFSGYTDIARGISRMLGLELARNFDEPYGATSVSEFWRRWHISLSFWLRDYLYFPLGGSHLGLPRTVINLLVTMLLCGLWHGAAWNFVLWGLAHGAVMSIERVLRGRGFPSRMFDIVGLAVTSFILSVTWILFASSDLVAAFKFLGQITNFPRPVDTYVLQICLLTFVAGPVLSYFRVYGWLLQCTDRSNGLAFVVNTLLVSAIVLQLWRGVDVTEFVYFKF
ncbi:MBOAT family O-acyltransferase [Tardiphaga sp. 11_C7_N12_6]|uniref:MBOAT family O-acyltransferase n=1 Tax=Tardiphaga sp. 11_C7_N12_6 TaxID=3240789 RepID=UPI003F2924A7